MKIGFWTLQRELDRGGSSRVWQAHHDNLQIDAAVKILQSESTAAHVDSLPFLVREVSAACRVFHPNIVNLLDFGTISPGDARASGGVLHTNAPYLVLQYAAGGALADMRGKVAWPALRSVTDAILSALAHVHARGILHLDVKPSNLLFATVRRRPADIRLADFGIATPMPMLQMQAGGRFVLHPPEDIAGSAPYMAPEQFSLSIMEFGPHTDLYSTGITIWEMVCGRTPFPNWTLSEHASYRRTTTLPPLEPLFDVPEALDDWLVRLSHPNPWKRFETAADAMHALQRSIGSGSRVRPSFDTPSQHSVTPADSVAPEPPVPRHHADGQRRTPISSLPLTYGSDSTDVSPHTIASGSVPTLPDHQRAEHRRSFAYADSVAPPPISAPIPREDPEQGQTVWRSDSVLRLAPAVPHRTNDERDHLWQVLRRVHASGTPEVVLIEHSSENRSRGLCNWLCESVLEGGFARAIDVRYPGDPHPTQGFLFVFVSLFGAVGYPRAHLTRRAIELCESAGLPPTEQLQHFVERIVDASQLDYWTREDDIALVLAHLDAALAIIRAFCRDRPVVICIHSIRDSEALAPLLQRFLELPRGGSPLMLVATMDPGATTCMKFMLLRRVTVMQRPPISSSHVALPSTPPLIVNALALARAALDARDSETASGIADQLNALRNGPLSESARRDGGLLARPWQIHELYADIANARQNLLHASQLLEYAIGELFVEDDYHPLSQDLERGRIKLKYAQTLRRVGQVGRALTYAEIARSRYRNANAPAGIAMATYECGQILFEQRRWQLAAALFDEAAEHAAHVRDLGLAALCRLGNARCRLLLTGYQDADALHDLIANPNGASRSCMDRVRLYVARHNAWTGASDALLQDTVETFITRLYDRLSLPAALESVALDLAISSDREPRAMYQSLVDLQNELARTGIARIMIAEDMRLLCSRRLQPEFTASTRLARQIAAELYRRLGHDELAHSIFEPDLPA